MTVPALPRLEGAQRDAVGGRAVDVVISLPPGFIAGTRRGGIVDQSARVFFTITFAMPAF